MKGIPATLMRAGTSKGPFFDLRDLPEDKEHLKKILLSVMGSPHKKQIDGIGGATFVTSKVVMVKPSERKGIDVDYLFAQVFIDDEIVDLKPTCGNMMAGVAPFAVEKEWVKPNNDKTKVMVYNINTNSIAEMFVSTPNGQVNYTKGNLKIDGVPGTGAEILMRLSGIEGGATGQLFPTGNLKDTIQGIEVTMYDAGNLMIHMRATDFGLTGEETGNYFEDKDALMTQLESIRCEIAKKAGMGDVSNSVLPKIGLLSKPKKGGNIRSMYFTPKTFHPTHAVSGAVGVTTSAMLKGTIASECLQYEGDTSKPFQLELEHQSGKIPIEIDVKGTTKDDFKIISAGTYRTARKLFEGTVFY